MHPPGKSSGPARWRRAAWAALAAALLVGSIGLTAPFQTADRPAPAKMAPLDPKTTYFRFKVDLLYKGEPLTYDIYGACRAPQ